MDAEDYFLIAMQKRQEAYDKGVAEAREVHFETAVEPTHMSGILREPKPGAIQRQGSVRVPQPYIFVDGKRVSTARTRRFSTR